MRAAKRHARGLAVTAAPVVAVMLMLTAAAAADPILIDDFSDLTAWSVHPAEGVTAAATADQGALRLDVHFTRGSGYAVVRRPVALDLPSDYVFRFRLRGEIPANHLEFKLVDSTGQNVWWHVRRDLEFPREWRTMSVRKRQVRFAWGPAGGGELRRTGFIEIAVAAGEGGRGSVWLDELTLEALPPDSTLPPVRARASSEAPGGAAARAVDGSDATAWSPRAGDRAPWIELDLGRSREFGGLDLRWAPGRHLADYAVELSLDGRAWTAADSVRGGDGGRDPLFMPEREARFLRVRAAGPVRTPVALAEAVVRPLEWSATREAFFTALAQDAPRGTYPRPYSGEQCAWTVIGPDAGHEEALISEDGMIEVGKRMFSIEPFVRVDGKLVTWADASIEQSLAWDSLPVPRVAWSFAGDMSLGVCAMAEGDTARPWVTSQYVLGNHGDRPRPVTLYLAVRPFQANPPWQNIGFPGGTARIDRIELQGGEVRVNGDRGFLCRPAGTRFGAAAFAQGELIETLRTGRMPAGRSAVDAHGLASGVLAFELTLPPRSLREVQVRIPLRGFRDPLPTALASWPSDVPGGPPSLFGTDLPPRRLSATGIFLPPGSEVQQTVSAQLGWILVNRDGGALQPGSRNYDRSWIRDGSLTSAALLRLGRADVVRDFIEWFAPFQYENGKIPCCASDRGPDPVTENDSHGQFVWLVAEYFRYTGDRALVERMWPRISAAIAHMDSLRGDRRTAEFRAPDKRKFFGLLLPSISHEGYPNPMHSYWDDFFAYRGYQDAAYLARVLGRRAEQTRFAAARDTFARDLAASIALAMQEKGIDYVPGCAELGDFDATSTTVVFTPTEFAHLLPEQALRATFERYWTFFRDRRDGRLAWDGFTPYEMRTIGTFVRLGWRERADSLLAWFMDQRQPAGWRQWGEVAYRDPRAPKYVGDFPHTWCGSDFVRSVLDMLAYERGSDSTLVLAAGVTWRRLENGDAVRVRDLGTMYGPLSYVLAGRPDLVHMMIEAGPRIPSGGIVVMPPAPPGRPFRTATIDGKPAPLTRDGGVVVRALPARVELRP